MSGAVLSAEDVRHPLWHKIKRHLESEVARLRIKNDADMPIEETLAVRAEIRAVKKLIRLGEIHTPPEEPTY